MSLASCDKVVSIVVIIVLICSFFFKIKKNKQKNQGTNPSHLVHALKSSRADVCAGVVSKRLPSIVADSHKHLDVLGQVEGADGACRGRPRCRPLLELHRPLANQHELQVHLTAWQEAHKLEVAAVALIKKERKKRGV